MKKELLFLIPFFLALSGNTIFCMKKRISLKEISLKEEIFYKCVDKDSRTINDNEIKKLIEEKAKNKEKLKRTKDRVRTLKIDIGLFKCCSIIGCMLGCGLPFLYYLDIRSQYISSTAPPL